MNDERDAKATSAVDRRQFIRTGGLAGVAAAATVPAAAQTGPASPARPPKARSGLQAAYRNNIYTRLLGVRPHLPAHEHISRLSGSRMPREVVEAMAEASEFFVDLSDLLAAANARVASLLGAEAALITSGGFSAMTLGAAACLTGTDSAKVEALPHPTWPRRECLIQTVHRFDYDRAYRAAGMTIVEAATRDEFLKRISERTAMIAAISAVEHQVEFGPPMPKKRAHGPGADVMLPAELIEVGRKAGVPVLVDPASDIPPTENLTKFFKLGADLVVLSGGKAILGPQSTGVLAGRRDLIEAAALNAFPNANIGRGMKVGKEEIIGLVVALERYLKLDYGQVMRGWETKARYIADQLKGIPGVVAEVAVNTAGYTDVDLSWDESVIMLTPQELKDRLKQGEPPLVYDGTTVRTRCLDDGEEQLVAERLRRFFTSEAPRRRALREGKKPDMIREPMTFDEAARRLVEVGRRFDGRGWVLGTSGNFSLVVSDEPLRLAMTPSGAFKGELTPGGIVEVDGAGKPVAGGPARPSAEARLHLEIARLRSAGAVLHTHSVWSTCFPIGTPARRVWQSRASRC